MDSIRHKLLSPGRLTEPPTPSFLPRKRSGSCQEGRRRGGRAARVRSVGAGIPGSCRVSKVRAAPSPAGRGCWSTSTFPGSHPARPEGPGGRLCTFTHEAGHCKDSSEAGALRRGPPLPATEAVTQPPRFSDYINVPVMGDPPQSWLLGPKLQGARRGGSGLPELGEAPRRGAGAFVVAPELTRGFQ